MTVSFFTGVGAWVDAVAAAVTDGTAAQAVTLDARAARARADADAAAAAAAAASQAASALASARAATAGRSAAAAGAALDGALEKFGMVGDTLRVVVGTFGGRGRVGMRETRRQEELLRTTRRSDGAMTRDARGGGWYGHTLTRLLWNTVGDCCG